MNKELLYKMLKYPMNDWLLKNTKRNSLFTWKYNGKIYTGLDSLRRIWISELINKYYERSIK